MEFSKNYFEKHKINTQLLSLTTKRDEAILNLIIIQSYKAEQYFIFKY